MVVQHLQRILYEVDYLDSFQAGFRSGHGTETAMVVFLDGLLHEWDMGSTPILTVLDLLVAFDTMDRGIRAGVCVMRLHWLLCFLQDQFQLVLIERSHSWPLLYRIP